MVPTFPSHPIQNPACAQDVRAASAQSIRPDAYFMRLIYLLLTSTSCKTTSKPARVSFWYSYRLRLCQDDIALLLFMRTFREFCRLDVVAEPLDSVSSTKLLIRCFMERIGASVKSRKLIFLLCNHRSWAHQVSRALFCFPRPPELPKVIRFLHYTLYFLPIAAVLCTLLACSKQTHQNVVTGSRLSV